MVHPPPPVATLPPPVARPVVVAVVAVASRGAGKEETRGRGWVGLIVACGFKSGQIFSGALLFTSGSLSSRQRKR